MKTALALSLAVALAGCNAITGSSDKASPTSTAAAALAPGGPGGQAAGQSRPAPAGRWNILEAKTLPGVSYTGTVDVTPRGDMFDLAWKTTGGSYAGLAFLEGNRLLAGWGPTGNFGVVVYRIHADGSLDGRWSTPEAQGQVGTERAEQGKPGTLEGLYQVTGNNPGGKGSYKGTLSIAKNGEVYDLSWSVGATYAGVGLRSGDTLAVGWGIGGGFGVVEYTLAGDKAEGRWTLPKASKVGTERLGR